jgi:hypothetical protein
VAILGGDACTPRNVTELDHDPDLRVYAQLSQVEFALNLERAKTDRLLEDNERLRALLLLQKKKDSVQPRVAFRTLRPTPREEERKHDPVPPARPRLSRVATRPTTEAATSWWECGCWRPVALAIQRRLARSRLAQIKRGNGHCGG